MIRLIFLSSLKGPDLDRATVYLGEHKTVSTLTDLEATDGDILVSHGTSVIVPPQILGRFRLAYNVHSASPDYPGRDPHHFAIYDGVKRYGATCHVMTERVDAGPIVAVEWFDVAPDETPSTLLKKADKASSNLIQRIAPTLKMGRELFPSGDQWGKRKTTRADFKEMCKIPLDISREEFERRKRAFNADKYENLTVRVHGHTFRIER